MSDDKLRQSATDKLSTIERFEFDVMDQRIFDLKIANPRITDEQIAEIVNLSRTTVWNRRNKPAFKAALADYFKPAKDRIAGMVNKAARKYEKLIDSENETVAERACKSVLVSENILKDKLDVDATIHEPLIIKRPMAKEVIEITTDKKKLPGEK